MTADIYFTLILRTFVIVKSLLKNLNFQYVVNLHIWNNVLCYILVLKNFLHLTILFVNYYMANLSENQF